MKGSTKKPVILAVGIALLFVITEQYLTYKTDIAFFFYNGAMLTCFVIGVWRGPNASEYSRWTITLILFYNASYNSLFGKTIGPYITEEVIKNTILMWFLLSIVYLIPLVRLWLRSSHYLVVILYPLVTIPLGMAAGLVEEQIFKSVYSSGTGPKARWTVNIAWLAYDPETNTLSGSD